MNFAVTAHYTTQKKRNIASNPPVCDTFLFFYHILFLSATKQFLLFSLISPHQCDTIRGKIFFDRYYSEFGIRREKTVPRTPQENGVSERMNRTIMERARSMRLHAGLPLQFWADAVDTAVYLINRGPSTSLDGGIPVRAHAHRADDIMTAIRLRDEFNLDLVVEHCTDGHLIVDELKEAGVPVAVGPSLSNRAKVEMENVTFRTPGVLASAGIDVAIITDAPCTPIQYLPICAGMAMREGMTEEDAFKALTIVPAKILKVDDRLGSLTAGKDADVVVWNNHPMEIMGRPEMVFVIQPANAASTPQKAIT